MGPDAPPCSFTISFWMPTICVMAANSCILPAEPRPRLMVICDRSPHCEQSTGAHLPPILADDWCLCLRSRAWTPRNMSLTPVSAKMRAMRRIRSCAAIISFSMPPAVSCRVSGFSPWALRTMPVRCSPITETYSSAVKVSKDKAPEAMGTTVPALLTLTGIPGSLRRRSEIVH